MLNTVLILARIQDRHIHHDDIGLGLPNNLLPLFLDLILIAAETED